jgi:hypothetical protein
MKSPIVYSLSHLMEIPMMVAPGTVLHHMHLIYGVQVTSLVKEILLKLVFVTQIAQE